MNKDMGYVEHYTFTCDRHSAIESLAMDLPLRSFDEIKSSTTFLKTLKAVADDAIKVGLNKIKDPADIVAVRVLKPTHRTAVKAQTLHTKFKRDISMIEALLSKATLQKGSLLKKFSSKEYKSTIIQERMTCKGCGGAITVLRASGCNCPICGEEAVLTKQSNHEQIENINKKIAGFKLEIKNLTDAYNSDCSTLTKETDESDYHWLAISSKQPNNHPISVTCE